MPDPRDTPPVIPTVTEQGSESGENNSMQDMLRMLAASSQPPEVTSQRISKIIDEMRDLVDSDPRISPIVMPALQQLLTGFVSSGSRGSMSSPGNEIQPGGIIRMAKVGRMSS